LDSELCAAAVVQPKLDHWTEPGIVASK
jgi:hypothetical protein